MKKILSFILVICMLMTVAPVATFAQSADFTLKPEQATYTAKVGETVSVPVLLVPATDSVNIQVIGLNVEAQAGLTITAKAGKVPVSNNNGVNVDGNTAKVLYDAETVVTPTDAVLFTLDCTATTKGTYSLTPVIDELYDADYEVLGNADNVAVQNATITFEADAPAADADFDKFKAKSVYYDASEDAEHTGTGKGMILYENACRRLYNVATDDGLAAFKADANYESLGAVVEEMIAKHGTSYASYTDGDSAFNYVTHDGKPALFSTKTATRFKGNWKETIDSNIYYKVVDEFFTAEDTDVTIVLQYYDAPAGNISFKYSKQGGETGDVTFVREGTNTWVTKAINVNNALLTTGLKNTGLVDKTWTGRVNNCPNDTYISKFALLKTADYNDIMGIVPEEPEIPDEPENPDLPEDPAGEDACDFKKNSTYIGGEGFEYADKKDMEISSAEIPGLSESYGDRTKGSNAYIVEDPTNGLVLKVDHDQRISGTDQIGNVITKEINATRNADYIIMSHKFMRSAGSYVRFFPNFVFKKYSDGSTKNGRGLSVIANGANLSQEGHSAVAGLNLNEVLTKWTEWDYVINAKELTVDLYIDHKYVTTMDCTNGSNILKPSKSEYYVAGVAKYEIYFDRTSAPGPFYLDDIQVRTMSKEQYAATFAKDELTLAKTDFLTTEVLPTKTATYALPVVWTSANDQLTIAADGSLKLAAGVSKLENVVVTAAFAGTTKQFTINVQAEPKFAEYIFGFDADKGYKASSYNAVSDYYKATKDGLVIRNKLTKLDEPSTVYMIKNADGSCAFVDADAYNAYEGTKGSFNNVTYINPYGNMNGDSNSNRLAQVGPEGDKRDAIFGAGHIRLDGRMGGNANISSMIHLNVSEVFGATDNALTVEVDMLDNRGKDDKLALQYVNTAGKVVNAYSNERPTGNSGEWITVTFTLTDADFSKEASTGLGDHKQDFRINCAGLPTTISAIRVYDSGKKALTDADYKAVALDDFDVALDENGKVRAKADITAEEAADARLYVAYYDANGNLVGVATSAQATNGEAQTLLTAASVGANFNAAKHTIKTFVWDADLKPLR